MTKFIELKNGELIVLKLHENMVDIIQHICDNYSTEFHDIYKNYFKKECEILILMILMKYLMCYLNSYVLYIKKNYNKLMKFNV